MHEVSSPVVSGLISGVLSSTIVVALVRIFFDKLKEKAAVQQKIMEFLYEKRQAMSDKPELLTVLGLLKSEEKARLGGLPPVSMPHDMNGDELRNLPAFLESIGIYLEYNPNTFNEAYGYFAQEVLLCAKSDLLWKDSERYDESVYWTSFHKFVIATKEKGPVLAPSHAAAIRA